MSASGTYDLNINAGTTFVLGLTLKKSNGTLFDLTGYTARGQIRKTHTEHNVEASFNIAFDTNRKSGKLSISLSEVQTKTLSIVSGVYDLELIDSTGTVVTRLIEGKVRVSPEVTR